MENLIKNQRQQEIERDTWVGIKMGLEPCKIKSESVINRLARYMFHKDICIQCDYAPIHNLIYDRRIISYFTPVGISQIEENFMNKIKNDENLIPENNLKLERAILTNPHLHPVIRLNLYWNLKRKQQKEIDQ